MTPAWRGGIRWSLVGAAALALAYAQACSNKPPPRPRPVTPAVVRDVPAPLRGTIGAESSINGAEPTLVSGYGFIVGLRGTGGLPLPPAVQATMERELGLRGVSRTSGAFRGSPLDSMTPSQVLRSPDTAVVEVWSAIPPGSPEGARFDVVVRAVNATSLEGGQLWSAELRISAPGQPVAFGGVQAKKLAEASGAVFVNPFTQAGRGVDAGAVTGRVLDGGRVTDPLQLEIVLDNPSHARARAIAAAIVSRFPEEPGDGGAIARGRNESSVALRIPHRLRNQPADFLDVVRHMPINVQDPEQVARNAVEGVKREPALANELSWMMTSSGPQGLSAIRELYDWPEPAPRMAALAAGARLNDPVAVDPLLRAARQSRGIDRLRAIRFVAMIDAGPRVDAGLKPLLGEPDLTVRVAAYEALVDRATKGRLVRLIDQQMARDPGEGPPVSASHLEVLAQQQFPADDLRGIERRLIEGRFLLDLVPFGDPLIYVTQQGRPRVVLFGAALALNQPSLVSVWDDRLLINAEGSNDSARVFYRDPQATRPIIVESGVGLADVAEVLGRPSRPEEPRAGLGLTFSEVVSALYAVQRAKAVDAAFATEEDTLRAQILTATRSSEIRLRPETTRDESRVISLDPGGATADPAAPAAPERPQLVPIVPPQQGASTRR
jgi:flagellar basal body P-ring protein FlgI